MAHRRALTALAFLCVVACAADPGNEAAADLPDVGTTPGDALADAGPDAPLPPDVAAVAAPGPYGVGVSTLELVDDTRPTPPNGDFAGAATRTLTTELWYPAPAGTGTPDQPARDAAVAPASAPQPLIVYVHGFMSGRNENAHAAALLASRGFVVAAPDGPLTNLNAPGKATPVDVLNEPGDVSFVIDTLLARGDASPGDGLVPDAARIGVVGVSLGAMAAALVGFREGYRDARLAAVATVAAPGCYLPDGFFDAVGLPLLLLHGTLDEVVPYSAHALRMFAAARAPKWLVSIQGGTHTGIAGIGAAMVSTMANPDKVGCVAMTTNANVSAEALAQLAADAGGETVAAVLNRCPSPCSREGELPPALSSLVEVDIVELALVSFFQARLGGDAAYGAFLEVGLPAARPDATVQFER